MRMGGKCSASDGVSSDVISSQKNGKIRIRVAGTRTRGHGLNGSRARRRARLPFSPWHLVLVPATLILIFPFFWLLITSLETPSEALHFPPILIPHALRFANYPDALNSAPFGHFFVNSAVVAVVTVLCNLVFCSLAGYAF